MASSKLLNCEITVYGNDDARTSAWLNLIKRQECRTWSYEMTAVKSFHRTS